MLIIVMGLSGSGKSFFGEKLALKLDAQYINSDRVRKEKNAEGKYAEEDKLTIYKEMEKRADIELQNGKKVVLDATFYLRKMRKRIIDLAAKQSVPICFYLIEADENITKERLSKPRKYSEADYGVYELIREKFEPHNGPHLKLQSTQNNISEMLKKAIHYLNDHEEGRS